MALTVETDDKDSSNEAPANEPTTPTDATTMKAVLVKEFAKEEGEVDDIMCFDTAAHKPTLSKKPKSKDMIVRVLACSISPGDTMMIRGNARFMHPNEFPFVPGMDIAGVVEEVDEGVTEFKVGDTVVANNGMFPVGGMAEFMLVKATNAVLKPESVDAVDAAACSSAVTSLQAVDHVKVGDRVLILGGSGGVGTSAIALSKHAGAAFIACTSTDEELCKSLGADEVINYKEKTWWENLEFQTQKFDKIIDTVGGGNFEDKAVKVLKTRQEGGRFIAVAGDDPRPDASTWLKAIGYVAKLPVRPLWTMLTPRKNPGYILLLPHDETKRLARVLKLMEEGSLKIALDPSSPLPFTDEGVKTAFTIQGSGRAHGKIVVKIEG